MPGNALPAVGEQIDFTPGIRTFSGNQHQRVLDWVASYLDNLTAKASGGQSGATLLAAAINNVTTVASANDSVMLPVARPGLVVYVSNSAATNSMQVFGNSADSATINGTAGSTGVAQAAGKSAVYFCVSPTKWFRDLSA